MFTSVSHLLKKLSCIIILFIGTVNCTNVENDLTRSNNEVSDTINIGEQLQLFIDGRYLQKKKNVRIVVQRPKKTNEKCLVDGLRGYGNIMEVDGTFRGFDALSKDGAHFRRVERGTKPEPDDIVGYLDGMPVLFKDPTTSLERRYILANPKAGWIKASEDGAHWETVAEDIFPKEAYFPRGMDSQNVIFYDTRLGKYVSYVRVNKAYKAPPERIEYFAKASIRSLDTIGYHFLRNVGRSESDNISRFPMPEVVFGPDDLDPHFGGVGVMDFYNPNVMQYQQAQEAYFLISPRYLHYEDWYLSDDLSNYRPSSVGTYNTGPQDIGFAASRDGINWQRYERKPWIPLGMEGTFDSKNMYPTRGMVIRKNEIWMYYTGYSTLHGDSVKVEDRQNVLSRVVLRKDGFTAVEADYEGGEFTTPLLTFAGEALHLNLNTSSLGILRVEIQDERGNSIEGYRMEDCDRIHTANTTDRVVSWNGKSDLNRFSDQPIRLRFEMKYGVKLYSFQFGYTN